MTFAHILFPVDFSERAMSAAPHVREIASHFRSTITLMNVIKAYWTGTAGEFAAFDDSYMTELTEKVRRGLTRFAEDHLGAAVREVCVEEGEPAEAITRFARDYGIDLIMMPSHGYGPFRRLLLGSVTAKVLHDAECPVWTGAHLEAASATNHIQIRNVLCAIDVVPKSVALMHWASQFSRSWNAGLRFVHAVPGTEAWPDRQFDREFEEELRRDARERIRGFQKEAGTSASVCIGAGSVASVVEEEARRHGSDLVVIGRGCLQEKLGRLRTHAYGIIRQAPCPVISI